MREFTSVLFPSYNLGWVVIFVKFVFYLLIHSFMSLAYAFFCVCVCVCV